MALLDLGGSAVKAHAVDARTGAVVAHASRPTPVHRPDPLTAEADPDAWEAALRAALDDVAGQVTAATAGPVEWLGVTVCSLRQGYVLLGADGRPVGPAVLNSDRRGAAAAEVLAGRHATTGHWPAPELTLPKLVVTGRRDPDLLAAARRLLFVHDWVLWLLSGEQVTEVSYACAGGMADVAARAWDLPALEEHGLVRLLAPLVEPGTPVGALGPGWPLPAGTPVVAGVGDTQLAAAGSGGLGDGTVTVVTVVAGSSTPVQASSAAPVIDPLGRPWVSTHATRDRWAFEGNAGYPGTFTGWWDDLAPGDTPVTTTPGPLVAVTATPWWSQQTWEHRPPAALVGLTPATTRADVSRALRDAHALAVRGNLLDLERVLGRPVDAVVVTGGAAADGTLPHLLTHVLGRPVHHAAPGGAARAAAALVSGGPLPPLPTTVLPAGDDGPWRSAYDGWLAAHETLRLGADREEGRA